MSKVIRNVKPSQDNASKRGVSGQIVKFDTNIMKAILGKKIIMTRIFDEKGKVIPVTLMKFEKNIVTFVKSVEKHGYAALQIGTGLTKKLNKPEKGHLKLLNDENLKFKKLYEIKTEKQAEIGSEIALDEFNVGEKINATGVSKGKGFAGTVKRHNFNTGPKTHGSHNYRQPGSIGATDAARVFKGKRMAGHMGNERTTVTNLEIIHINTEKTEILVRGALPGIRNADVLIWSRNEN